MWLGDNCHTYDRARFEAQLECGIGRYENILHNATQTHFNVTFYPYVQEAGNYQCLQDFIPNSYLNIFSGAHSMAIAALTLTCLAAFSF